MNRGIQIDRERDAIYRHFSEIAARNGVLVIGDHEVIPVAIETGEAVSRLTFKKREGRDPTPPQQISPPERH